MSYRREARVVENTWVLIADRSKATVYQANWPDLQPLSKVFSLKYADEMNGNSEVSSNRISRMMGSSVDHAEHELHTDFRHHTAKNFSIEIVNRLEQGRMTNQFGRLIIIAPALMLGVLRDQLSAPLSKKVVLEICKGLTDATVKEISSHLEDALTQQTEALAAAS
ncbi:host attachment protein [Planctomicrobium sp. SH668]|uniref:host attachment protein n=1 Tax=Planctomicrobium sp. SH668 TaxID=3448126 RepID=UPI003F5BA988